MLVIIKRFLIMLGICIFLSAVIGVLAFYGFVDGNMRGRTGILTIAAVAIFLYFNFSSLRNTYADIKNQKRYFLFNIIACLMFAMVNAVFYLKTNNLIYGFTFGITKFLSTIILPTGFIFGNILSAAILHFLLLVSVLLAPIGMDWIFLVQEEDEADLLEISKIENESGIDKEEFIDALVNTDYIK